MRIKRIVEKSSDTVGERGNRSNCWFYNFEDFLLTCCSNHTICCLERLNERKHETPTRLDTNGHKV